MGGLVSDNARVISDALYNFAHFLPGACAVAMSVVYGLPGEGTYGYVAASVGIQPSQAAITLLIYVGVFTLTGGCVTWFRDVR